MSEINTIKIPNNATVTSKRNDVPRDTNSTTQGAVNTAKSSDKVSLTNTATQLQSLQNTINDTPTVDQDRVSAIKAAIDDGSYKVDVEALAQNIISFESQIS